MRAVIGAVATWVVALGLALTVPMAMLQTNKVVISCCCPDPANCHCPDHKPDHSGQPAVRACHRTKHEVGAPEAPSFTPDAIAIVIAPPRVAHAAPIALSSPHETPVTDEPYGPS